MFPSSLSVESTGIVSLKHLSLNPYTCHCLQAYSSAPVPNPFLCGLKGQPSSSPPLHPTPIPSNSFTPQLSPSFRILLSFGIFLSTYKQVQIYFLLFKKKKSFFFLPGGPVVKTALPTQQGPWVQSLVEEDPTCHVAQPKNNYLENKFVCLFFFWLHSVWHLSSLTRDQTCARHPPDSPALGAWSLNHWTIREVPEKKFFFLLSLIIFFSFLFTTQFLEKVFYLCP